ncbi:hypothetical protein [Photorhabdus luminescens]|uniref:hypothetical protein n=1 Tax=Photorhabdus luminescens TaxID=29488 RepID=UPI0018656B28|nr:hypothetical protein [Photorhabdus luminescens]
MIKEIGIDLNIISISVICSGFETKKLNAGKRENLIIILMEKRKLNVWQETKEH